MNGAAATHLLRFLGVDGVSHQPEPCERRAHSSAGRARGPSSFDGGEPRIDAGTPALKSAGDLEDARAAPDQGADTRDGSAHTSLRWLLIMRLAR